MKNKDETNNTINDKLNTEKNMELEHEKLAEKIKKTKYLINKIKFNKVNKKI